MDANGQSVAVIRRREHDVAILTVDDNDVFRLALRDVIGASPGFGLVGEACCGEEAIRAVELLLPQLVLMDLAMPGIGGAAAARDIVNRHPEVAVWLISVDDPLLDPEAFALGNAVICLRKQDLRPLKLRELWDTQQGGD